MSLRYLTAVATALVMYAPTIPCALGAEWRWTWPAPAGAEPPAATVCAMKYGKLWGYSIELDDGNRETGLLAPALFAEFQYTDAPPGIAGGTRHPVVGGLAAIAGSLGGNSTILNVEELRAAEKSGWGIVNHSYAHRGRTWGNPPELMSPEELREDLFWSQVVLAAASASGRAPTHFVYPNGYQGYSQHLAEMGMVSGSRVGGSSGRVIQESRGGNPLDIGRSYLDEGRWASDGSVMFAFPKEGPAEGDIIIDFTHGIDPDPASPNRLRWAERLGNISKQYGADGSDTFWSAPPGDLVNYVRAASQAEVNVEPGGIRVTIPDDLPGSPLTIRLEGIPEKTALQPPPGGKLFRQGDTVWVTSPTIGAAAGSLPRPSVKLVYEGAFSQTITLDKPTKVAAVRLKAAGRSGGELLKVEAVGTDGTNTVIGERTIADGQWRFAQMLFATVPNREAPMAKAIRVTAPGWIKGVEVWGLAE